MKAVVLHQPYATLVALGVKTIETRPSPPNGPMRPEGVRGLPGLAIEPGERIAIVAGASHQMTHTMTACGGRHFDHKADGRWVMYQPPLYDLGAEITLPLGALVCTVVVADALPMVDTPDNPFGTSGALLLEGDDLLTYWCGDLDDDKAGQFDGQLPYGDFAPGRWGWLLADVKPTAPIPCKGKQGVFRLPDDITEALS